MCIRDRPHELRRRGPLLCRDGLRPVPRRRRNTLLGGRFGHLAGRAVLLDLGGERSGLRALRLAGALFSLSQLVGIVKLDLGIGVRSDVGQLLRLGFVVGDLVGVRIVQRSAGQDLAGPVSYTHLDVYKRQTLECVDVAQGSGGRAHRDGTETRRRCGRPREHIQPDIHATQVSKGHQKDESPDPYDGAEEPREHTQPRAHPGHSVSGGAHPQRQARAVGRVVALDEGDGDWGDSRRLTRGGSGRQLAQVDEAEAWPIGGAAMA